MVSADSRKSAEKCRKVRRTALFAQKVYNKYAKSAVLRTFRHFSALFLESAETPLFVQINVFAVWPLRLDRKYTSLGHPSRTLEGNSRKRSESVSGVFRMLPELLPESPSRTGSLAHVIYRVTGNLYITVAICAKAFWPPKSPESTQNAKFSRKAGVAPKSPRNSHWIHTKRHTKPHWIPLNSPEFSRNFPNFPKFAQIPLNPWNLRGNQGRRGIHAISHITVFFFWN